MRTIFFTILCLFIVGFSKAQTFLFDNNEIKYRFNISESIDDTVRVWATVKNITKDTMIFPVCEECFIATRGPFFQDYNVIEAGVISNHWYTRTNELFVTIIPPNDSIRFGCKSKYLKNNNGNIIGFDYVRLKNSEDKKIVLNGLRLVDADKHWYKLMYDIYAKYYSLFYLQIDR